MGHGMKKTVYISIFMFVLQTSCFARDFIVEFLDENYQETQSAFSYSPIIYHSIQVRTQVGPKLLILKGDDYNYRQWLREYIAENKSFVAKVQEDENELFISSSAFEIDVTNIHPLNLSKYKQVEKNSKNRLSRLELKNYQSTIPNKSKIKKKTGQNTAAKPEKEKLLKQKNDNLKKEKALEQENQMQAFKQQQAEDKLKLQKALDEQKKIQQALIASIAEQQAMDERQRRAELEERWLELKARLLENDRLRGMELKTRNQEIEKRWLELKTRYGF
jgi:hypothetical protein